MATVSSNRLRPGMKIVDNGELWVVTEFQHRTPGNLRAFVVCKLKNIKDGRVVEKTFRGAESDAELAEFEQKTCQFLFSDPDGYHMMDNSTFEQFALPEELLGHRSKFLQPDSDVIIGFWQGEAVDVILPGKMTFKVVSTIDDIARGNSANNITKDAELDCGLVVQVPPFIKTGEEIIVSTEDGSYVSRA